MAEEQTDDTGGGGDEAARAELEQKARARGWKPKDQWKGDTSNWVDADVYLEKSESVLPYIQHDRQRLEGELGQTRAQLSTVQQQLKDAQEALEGLTTLSNEMAEDRRERRKGEIGDELKAAREAGDEVKVAELTNELQTLVKPAEKKEVKKSNGEDTQNRQPVIQPWVRTFLEDNSEFMKDPRKVALFNVEMLQRRQAGDGRVGDVEGTALLNEARDAVEKLLGGNSRRQAPSKTEESRPAGGGPSGGGPRGKGYADMPADARAKCDAQEKKYVGVTEDGKKAPGKAFKTQAEWRAHFAREWFSPSVRAIERATE